MRDLVEGIVGFAVEKNMSGVGDDVVYGGGGGVGEGVAQSEG